MIEKIIIYENFINQFNEIKSIDKIKYQEEISFELMMIMKNKKLKRLKEEKEKLLKFIQINQFEILKLLEKISEYEEIEMKSEILRKSKIKELEREISIKTELIRIYKLNIKNIESEMD